MCRKVLEGSGVFRGLSKGFRVSGFRVWGLKVEWGLWVYEFRVWRFVGVAPGMSGAGGFRVDGV